jgi:signal transduction histidine kinase
MHARKYYEQIHYEELQEEIENLLKAIRTGSTRAAKIVSSLQKFSSHTDKPAAVNINEIIEDTLALFHSEVKYDIELHKKLSVNLPPLQVLSVELSQVFFNMIINAIQAMNGHGILRIETGLSNGQILIRIADNGPGISKENIDKIFDAFFTTKEVGKGTGLGLYISKKIIEGYGGTIVAHSKFGEGTEFEIRIPVDVQAD